MPVDGPGQELGEGILCNPDGIYWSHCGKCFLRNEPEVILHNLGEKSVKVSVQGPADVGQGQNALELPAVIHYWTLPIRSTSYLLVALILVLCCFTS